MKHVLLALLLIPLFESGGVAAALQSCPSSVPLLLAPTGCRGGSAVASVDPVDGATYSWTIQGGTLVSGAGTERAVIAIGSGQTVKVSLLINSPSCGTQSAAAVMALHDPFSIRPITVTGGTHAGQLRTLTWQFDNGEPVVQTLSGTDFPKPVVLPGSARSYTYTPALYGDKSVVLDAATVPPPARTRAVGRGGAVASSCSSVRGEAKFHVDCNTPAAKITAPAATGVGLPFTASVTLAAGTSASWTIANGTPATATGDAVSIVPTGNAPVDIHVTVSADTCTATASAQVQVDPALGCAVVPQATLSLKSSDCDKGVIAVRLVGTPPFSGTWSDGEPFAAVDFGVERTVTAAADYTIKNFHDAFCPGQAGTLHVSPKPTATLSTSGSACLIGEATAVVTFTGTPPFLGEWSDSVAFNTTATRLERTITAPADLTLKWFQDAKCAGVVSGHAAFGQQGTATARLADPADGCLLLSTPPAQVATIAVDLTGTPPFTVTWSDGVEQTVSTTPALRAFAPPRGFYTLTVTRASDAYCDLKILNASVSLGAATLPQLRMPDAVCPGTQATASITNVLPSAATITWHLDHGVINSGQGTKTVTFTPTTQSGQGAPLLSVEVADPTSCNATVSAPVKLIGGASSVVSANPSILNLGESTTISLTPDPVTTIFSYISIYTPVYEVLPFCYSGTCTYNFTPKGSGRITLYATSIPKCNAFPYINNLFDIIVK